MVGVIAAVLGLERGGCRAQRLARIAGLGPLRCFGLRITRRGGEVLEALLAVEAPRLSYLRPGGGMGQRFSCRESRPRRLGDDTDAIRHPDHLDHARYGLGYGLVDLVGRGSLDRRA